VKNKLNMNF